MTKGRAKGGKNQYWSKEDKYKIIKPILEFETSSREVTRETGIINGMINNWIKNYNEKGINGLENQKKPGEESIKYPNLINNNWKTTRPLEKITSDTTMIWFKKQRYDWTYYVDAFDDSIIGSDVKPFYHIGRFSFYTTFWFFSKLVELS